MTHLVLSPASSGERAEAGLDCGSHIRPVVPAEGEGRLLAQDQFLVIAKLDVATAEQVAAPHPDPLPLRAKSARGRGESGGDQEL
jgi:hypothetical protein